MFKNTPLEEALMELLCRNLKAFAVNVVPKGETNRYTGVSVGKGRTVRLCDVIELVRDHDAATGGEPAAPAPNPSPAAKGGEVVVVPYDDFHAAYRFVPRSKVSPDRCLKTRLRALLRAEDLAHADEAEALAIPSPQPADAVREALAEQDIVDAKSRRIAELEAQLAAMEARKDGAYKERNRVVAALAKVFPSGTCRTDIPGWSDDWHGCVRIDLPTGQVSWHFHDSHAHLFADLPAYAGEWDGHDTPEKYRRLATLASDPAPAGEAVEPVGFINESFRDGLVEQKGKGYWHHQMVCGKRFDGSFPIYLARPASEDTARLREDLERVTRERDTFADICLVVSGHLELPHSESGPCDDSRRYDRELTSLEALYRRTEDERVEHMGKRFKAEAEAETFKRERDDARKALETANGLISDARGAWWYARNEAKGGHLSRIWDRLVASDDAARSASGEGASDG